MKTAMKCVALVFGRSLAPSGDPPEFAFYYEGGRQPVPPEAAERMALPLWGFAATKRWGPNGCQLRDCRNPFSTRSLQQRRAYQIR